MALWKQAILAMLVLGGAIGAWMAVDPTARTTLAEIGIPVGAIADAAPSSGGEARGRGGRGGGGDPPVILADVEEATTNDRVNAIGTAEANRSVTLYPRADGIVAEMAIEPGAPVAAGTLLLKLDSQEQEIAADRARLAIEDAEAKVQRYERLSGSSSISSVERDTARSELRAAELALREAEVALERRRVVAPFDGVVDLTDVEVGDYVTSSTAIASIDDRHELVVEFRVPESYASMVEIGQPVTASTPARPLDSFEGEVSALGSRVEADSRTLRVQARIDNSDDRLRPGISFMVAMRFPGDSYRAVPPMAVQWDRDGPYVWRLAAGEDGSDVAETVRVDIMQRDAERVLVSGDLEPGEEIVVEGMQRLRDGVTVIVAGRSPGRGGETPADETSGGLVSDESAPSPRT